MNDVYKEFLVKRECSIIGKIVRYGLLGIAIISFILGMLANIILMLIGVIAFIASYYVNLITNLEYEYLYVDKELSVDKIMAMTKRKKVEAFSMDKMTMIAPTQSHQLDVYRTKNLKVTDFSSKDANPQNPYYSMIYLENREIIFEVPREFMKAIYQIAPRKVFLD